MARSNADVITNATATEEYSSAMGFRHRARTRRDCIHLESSIALSWGSFEGDFLQALLFQKLEGHNKPALAQHRQALNIVC